MPTATQIEAQLVAPPESADGHTERWVEDEAGICSLDDDDMVAIICRPDGFWGVADEDLPPAVVDKLTRRARLIAAAPDLLAALKWLLTEAVGNASDDELRMSGASGNYINGVLVARAAIARAMGAGR